LANFFNYLKQIFRRTQLFLERFVLGGFIQDLIWQYKHKYQQGWTQISIDSINLPHRAKLISMISSVGNAPSIIEIGCAAGPNLRLLREKFPLAHLAGIDINKSAIEEAQNYFASVNDNKTAFYVGKAHKFNKFENQSFDVVFSQAVLLHHPPSRIDQAIKNMIRLSKNLVIFHEYHMDGVDRGLFIGGRWCYDYRKIISKYYPTAQIDIQQGGFKGGDWEEFGKFIVVKVEG